MLDDEIKVNISNVKDKQIVDEVMDELEHLGAKVKSSQATKHDDDDEYKKKKKHHHHRSPDSKHDRKKSSHKDRKRHRHSSIDSNSSDRSIDSNRSSSPKHHRSSKKSKHHDRNDSPPRRKGTSSIPDKPMVGSIYDGTVISIMQWGCFVRLDQFRNRTEGLVHISNIHKDRINNVTDVVKRHQKVKVKILSCTETKMSLSMKDVDQITGEDLNEDLTKNYVEK
jgi:ATP-dependent RNA helicase DHX8/PRP22